MVHYLLNAHEGRCRERFQAWLMDPVAQEGAAGLSAAIGVPFDDMVKNLREHLWRMTLPR